MPGIGLLPLETVAGERRMIGDVLLECELEPGERRTLAGFENHAGRTHLDPGAEPLGRVLAGFGNDGESGYEGCRAGRVVGTYLHGPLLPRNPWLADWLLAQALAHRTRRRAAAARAAARRARERARTRSPPPARARAAASSLAPRRASSDLLDGDAQRLGHLAVAVVAPPRLLRLAAAAARASRRRPLSKSGVRTTVRRLPATSRICRLTTRSDSTGRVAARRVAVVDDDVRDAARVADAREERHVALAAALEHEDPFLVRLDAERLEDERERQLLGAPLDEQRAQRARKSSARSLSNSESARNASASASGSGWKSVVPPVGRVADERELLEPVDAEEDRRVRRVEDLVPALRERAQQRGTGGAARAG